MRKDELTTISIVHKVLIVKQVRAGQSLHITSDRTIKQQQKDQQCCYKWHCDFCK